MDLHEQGLKAATDVARKYGWTELPEEYPQEFAKIVEAYLAATQPEDGVEVRICVAVDESGQWSAFGKNDYSDNDARETAWISPATPIAYRWVKARVPAYQPPVEPSVKGRVAE